MRCGREKKCEGDVGEKESMRKCGRNREDRREMEGIERIGEKWEDNRG